MLANLKYLYDECCTDRQGFFVLRRLTKLKYLGEFGVDLCNKAIQQFGLGGLSHHGLHFPLLRIISILLGIIGMLSGQDSFSMHKKT